MGIKTIKLTKAIDCEQFIDATKLFRVTTLSLHFMRNLKAVRNQRGEPQNTKPTLTIEEISNNNNNNFICTQHNTIVINNIS